MSGQLNLTALNASTTVTANKFVGDGSELTGVNTGNTAHGTLPSFSAWLNSASTTVNEGEVIPFNMTSFNNGDHYDASTTFKFTAPTKGQYTFVFSIGDVQSDNSVERIITFYKNGNVYRDAYNNNVNELGDADANAPVLLDLATGDTVDVRMRKGSITLDDGDLGAVNKPTFFGYKVGYGDGAMNVDYVYETLPAFRAHYMHNTAVDITGGARITTFEEQFDIGSNFDAGVFTAPSNGVYLFGVSAHIYTDPAWLVTLRINDVNNTDLIEPAGTTEEEGASIIVNLSAGDTVDIIARYYTLSMPAVPSTDEVNGINIKFWGYKVGYGDGVSIKTFTKSGSVAFYNDGNVGIGTETPTEKLEVAGGIDCTSLGASLANVVIDATYPVGTILDRATAITDTHLNGKFKAFLGAPNQEWELKSSPELPVSFKVTYDQPGTITYSGQVIPMSIINSNIGSGWNATTNSFVAPRTGTYVFGALLNQSDQASRIIIRKNGSNQTDVVEYALNGTYIYAGHQNNTGTCMLNLSANDSIDLYAGTTAQGMDVTLQFNNANFHSSFSARFEFYGYLIDDSKDNYKYERTA